MAARFWQRVGCFLEILYYTIDILSFSGTTLVDTDLDTSMPSAQALGIGMDLWRVLTKHGR